MGERVSRALLPFLIFHKLLKTTAVDWVRHFAIVFCETTTERATRTESTASGKWKLSGNAKNTYIRTNHRARRPTFNSPSASAGRENVWRTNRKGRFPIPLSIKKSEPAAIFVFFLLFIQLPDSISCNLASNSSAGALPARDRNRTRENAGKAYSRASSNVNWFAGKGWAAMWKLWMLMQRVSHPMCDSS